MNLHLLKSVYQMIAFLFAISVHESAHAWTAIGAAIRRRACWGACR